MNMHSVNVHSLNMLGLKCILKLVDRSLVLLLTCYYCGCKYQVHMAHESDQGILEVRKHIQAYGKSLNKKALPWAGREREEKRDLAYDPGVLVAEVVRESHRVAQGGKPSFEGVCGISYILSLKIHTTKWEEEDSPSSTVELTVF